MVDNYRGITLISVALQVLMGLLVLRFTPIGEETLMEEQGGFRAKRSTTDQMFSARQVIEKVMEWEREAWIGFVCRLD